MSRTNKLDTVQSSLSPVGIQLSPIECSSKFQLDSIRIFSWEGFYVDDGFLSVPTVEDNSNLVTRTRNMLKRGGFVLHKFRSNSTELLQTLPAESIAVKVNKLDLSDLPTEHILGVLWNASEDNFTFKAKLKARPLTRRDILSTVRGIFDP
ncbi:hypothetical protein HOLleu_39288 [Holothuria leucospilota]|uniref:Uncharacterized protein n=1 Tax=Holothuria leucospilota TaxID=206669 RepID=A0A9Q0YKL5_HOLLE|nr:hypothetical protein HOLleu_39288 [Holothuria leucospilota]